MTPAQAIVKLAELGLPTEKLAAALEILQAMEDGIKAPITERRNKDKERKRAERLSKDVHGNERTKQDMGGHSKETPSPLVPPLEVSPAPLPKTPPIIPPSTEIGLSGAEIEIKLREAAGWQNEPAPMLAVTGEIEALLGQGASLDLDVLPIVKALGRLPKRRTSWKYFIPAIRDAWQSRVNAAATGPPVAQIVPFSQPISGASRETNRPKPSRQDFFATVRARLAEADADANPAGDERDGTVIEGQAVY